MASKSTELLVLAIFTAFWFYQLYKIWFQVDKEYEKAIKEQNGCQYSSTRNAKSLRMRNPGLCLSGYKYIDDYNFHNIECRYLTIADIGK